VRAAGIVVVQDSSCSGALASSPLELPFVSRNLALLDLLGKSVLTRTISRLQWYGIQPVSVVSNSNLAKIPQLDWDPTTANLEYDRSGDHWLAVERLLFEYAESGVKVVLLIQLGAYAELNYFDLLRFHRANGKVVTTVAATEGPLQTAVGNLTEPIDCLELFQDLWSASPDRDRSNASRFMFHGYVNRLRSPYNLRQLARDALECLCELRPVGHEIKPGIWLGPGVRVHARAGIIKPAYIGAYSKIRAAAVVTRGSSIERHCEVDCGTIIDDTNVLPFSCVGPGLALRHALVDGGRLLHLGHNVELQIRDRRLLSPIRPQSSIVGLRDIIRERILNAVFPAERFASGEPRETASLFPADQIAP
jgi:NDP-sugar pyrophosphorylase family protein